MTDPARTTVAVTYLVDDADARRLVVAWPQVEPGLADSALLVAWSRAAGVALSKTRRLAELLRRHRLVHDDRTVDAEATKVITHVAAEQLRSSTRRPR